MEQHELHRLIDKYLNGTATEEERAQLLDWYRQQNAGEVIWELENEQEEDLKERIKTTAWRKIIHEQTPVRINRWKIYTAAAALAVVIGISLWWSTTHIPESSLVVTSSAKQVENRFVLLADSSRVILKPGSRLEYRSDFNEDSREVALIGEAYFDIKRDETKPFIIHTGEVQTVVLGTAFSIKTDKEAKDVQVTVQRGKVRVENMETVLGELLANEQLLFEGNIVTKKTKEELKDKVKEVLAWTAEDMRFDAQPFGDLTQRLERRYGVRIQFEDPSLSKCPISGKFQGVETLEEVLTSLCATRNAHFRNVDKDEIVIVGKGCAN